MLAGLHVWALTDRLGLVITDDQLTEGGQIPDVEATMRNEKMIAEMAAKVLAAAA